MRRREESSPSKKYSTINGGSFSLRVLSEGVIAFCAPEKLRRRLVASSCLHLPNINLHVAALGTLHTHGWHCAYLIFFTYDSHFLLQIMLYDFRAHFNFEFFLGHLLNIATFGANQRNNILSLLGYES
jgi:hypothetical protein